MVYSFLLWWLVVHKSAKHMMEFQMDLEGWLGESTLFPNQQQICHHTTTDLYPETKDVPALSNIGDGWLDEKLDLSTFDFQDNWLEPQNDSAKMIAEDASISFILDYLMGSNPVDATVFTPETEAVKILPDDLEKIANEVFSCEITSPEGDFNSFTEETNSPPSEDFSSSIGSPTSSVCGSIYSDPLTNLQDEKPEIFEYVGVLNETCVIANPNSEEISEDAESDQSSVGPIFSALGKFKKSSPYPTKKEARKERKKVQNKEAAARYRTKKRIQDQELSDEVQKLETEQKALQTKYDQLKNELTYLKSLMREMKERKKRLK